jgi:plastocyanin
MIGTRVRLGAAGGALVAGLLLAGTAVAADGDVTIAGFAFSPGTVTVSVGDTVTWTNNDNVGHTATGDGFDTGTIGGGSSASVTFDTVGTFAYHCSIHPTMNGTVVVKAASGGKPTTPATDTAALVAGDAGDAGPGVIALLGLAALGGLLVTLRRTARREGARA